MGGHAGCQRSPEHHSPLGVACTSTRCESWSLLRPSLSCVTTLMKMCQNPSADRFMQEYELAKAFLDTLVVATQCPRYESTLFSVFPSWSQGWYCLEHVNHARGPHDLPRSDHAGCVFITTLPPASMTRKASTSRSHKALPS